MTQSGEAINRNWVPMYWPAGPLEIARREKAGDLTADGREAIGQWAAPAALDLLKGSAINCLLVRWAAGTAGDRAHQEALSGLIARGRQAGLSFIGCVSPEANEQEAATAARAAGLSALAFEKGQPKTDFPKLVIYRQEDIPWGSSDALLAVRENVWPGIQGRNVSETGPTGNPWIDSNLWFVQLANVRSKRKPIWLQFDPPGKNAIVEEQAYVVALADTAAGGARWIVSLDDRLRAGLSRGDARSVASWKTIANTVGFFEQHKDWRELQAAGVMGVVSDWGQKNEAGEYLNMLIRRVLPPTAIELKDATPAAFAGLKGILAMDPVAPSQDLRQKLMAFAQQGGFLFTSAEWGTAGLTQPGPQHPRFAVYRLGKGRIAVAKKSDVDQYVVTEDAHMLLSRTNDLVRLFNSTTSLCAYVESNDRKKGALHVINYSGTPGDEITTWVARPKAAARLCVPGAQPAPIETTVVSNGTEYFLPAVGTFASVDIG
jgi:hypothetical protein